MTVPALRWFLLRSRTPTSGSTACPLNIAPAVDRPSAFALPDSLAERICAWREETGTDAYADGRSSLRGLELGGHPQRGTSSPFPMTAPSAGPARSTRRRSTSGDARVPVRRAPSPHRDTGGPHSQPRRLKIAYSATLTAAISPTAIT